MSLPPISGEERNITRYPMNKHVGKIIQIQKNIVIFIIKWWIILHIIIVKIVIKI